MCTLCNRRERGRSGNRRNKKQSLLEYLAHDRWRQRADAFGFSCTPVETSELVGESCTGNLEARRDENFERVAFDLSSQWNKQSQASSPVVRSRREHECRASPRLLVTGLGIKREPYEISPFGDILAFTRLRCQPLRQFRLRGADFVL